MQEQSGRYDSEDELGRRVESNAGRVKPFWKPRVEPGELYAREQRFVTALLELLAGGEPLCDATIIRAGRQAFRFGAMSEEAADARALRMGTTMMGNANVLTHFTDLFAKAGFEPKDAAEAHVRHIKEGNYQALRDYWKMTTPQVPKQHEVKAAVLHMSPDEFAAQRAPTAMAGRIIGALPPVGDTPDGTTATLEPARQDTDGSPEGTG